MRFFTPGVLLTQVLSVGLAVGSPNPNSPTLIRQDFTVENANYTYNFNMKIGTPPQMITVAVDFGSSDIILTPGQKLCLPETCSWNGFYNTIDFEESNTTRLMNSYVSVALASDGSMLYGLWANDNVTIGDLGQVVANDTSFIIRDTTAYSSSDGTDNSFLAMLNVFGLGPRGLQSTVVWVDDEGTPGPTYNNMLYNLDGVSPSFSIWVDPVTNARGSIVFGGIDDSLYVPGTLNSVPIASPPGKYNGLADPLYLAVTYGFVTATLRDGSINSPWQTNAWFVEESLAILNSRTRLSFPLPLLEQIGDMLSAEWASSEGMYLIRCDVEGFISLDLGNMALNISVPEHLINLYTEDAAGTPLCGLNIGESNQIYLSNKVLKNYFMYVDYENNEIIFGEQGNGPDTGQPQREHTMNTMKSASSYYDFQSVDPDFQIVLTASTGVTVPGPHFAKSQSSQFLLGKQPVPSIMNPDNNTVNSSVFSTSVLKNNAVRDQPTHNEGFLSIMFLSLVFSISSLL